MSWGALIQLMHIHNVLILTWHLPCEIVHMAAVFAAHHPRMCTQVFYFVKMEVKDFRNDVILAEACRSDVDKFCATVEPGDCLHLKLHVMLGASSGNVSHSA